MSLSRTAAYYLARSINGVRCCAAAVRENSSLDAAHHSKIGVIVIGRNEGQRLVDCIRSLEPLLPATVYVDSGSTDSSVAIALGRVGAVVELDMALPFTAARARNAGVEKLLQLLPNVEFIQFIDGDCLLDPDWVGRGVEFLEQRPEVALVFGRRRERYPHRSIYNSMCDSEWNTAIGEAVECGGDSLVRVQAFRAVDGFSSWLIAGEEPDLCTRLRAQGWKIWRIDAEMTMHDANLLHFWQWWIRNVRAGHAFAEVSRLHASSKFGIWQRKLLRSVGWTLLPAVAVIGAVTFHWCFLLLLLMLPLQVVRIALRSAADTDSPWRRALFSLIGKVAECQGVLRFYRHLWLGRGHTIIEYK